MASVYLARDRTLDRQVALKVMHPGLFATADMQRRFFREARLVARLNHPNIVAVHAVKVAGNIVVLELGLVDGTPLDRLISEREAPLPTPVACWLTATIADALHYAHTRGVVHRDVKAANVMVSRRGDPMLTDFGIALARGSARLTGAGHVIGTPTHMSPEQCQDQGLTSASDQYSLGVLGYELLTGRLPFRGPIVELQRAHVGAIPAAPHALVPAVPVAVSAVVMRMLAKRPGDRWPSLAAAADALMAVLRVPDGPLRRESRAIVAAALRSTAAAPHASSPHPDGSPAHAALTEVLSARALAARRRWARQHSAFVPMGLAAALAIAVLAGDGFGRGPAAAGAQAARAVLPPATFDRTLLADSSLDVSDTTLFRVAVSPLNVRLAVGESMPLVAVGHGLSGEPLVRRFLWHSDDTSVVHVSADGWINAVAPGSPVIVQAATGGVAGYAVVTVY
jgi:serine/threonine-protein kinase